MSTVTIQTKTPPNSDHIWAIPVGSKYISWKTSPQIIKKKLNSPYACTQRSCVVKRVAQPHLMINLDHKTHSETLLLKNFGAIAHRWAISHGFKAVVILWSDLETFFKKQYRITLSKESQAHVISGAFYDAYTIEKPFKDTKKPQQPKLIIQSKKALSTSSKKNTLALTSAIHTSRQLSDSPPNVCTPVAFANEAKKALTGLPHVSTKIYSKTELQKMGMTLFLSVNNGSTEPACLLEVTYKPSQKKLPKVALIGKGVTFDSGGYSLKPPQHMLDMKYDMCGGATMLGATIAASQYELPVHLKTWIPLTENLVNGSAVKVGDVIPSLSGQTVEILNTDAEGRLILADVLTYASQWDPEYMVNAATLTGAVDVALGKPATGIMGNCKSLAHQLQVAAEASGESVWELPLFDEYKDWLKSDVADIKNIAASREAGSSVGGAFLSYFVPDSIPWDHMDIAGTSTDNTTRHFYPKKGASGAMIMTLVTWLRQISELS